MSARPGRPDLVEVFIRASLCYTPGMFRSTVLTAIALLTTLFGCSHGSGEPAGPTPEQSNLLDRARRTIDAQEMYLQHGSAPAEPRYAQNLAELLTFDVSLTDDPAVTFHFGEGGNEGYRLILQRVDAAWHIECGDREDCRLVE